MNNDKKFEKQYEGLMAMYEATNDTNYLVVAYKLWADKKIEIKDVDHYFEVPTFYKNNKYGKACSRCNCQLHESAVFGIKDRILNKNKYWCVSCATAEEKQNSFYINWSKSSAQPKIENTSKRYMPNSPGADSNGFVNYLSEDDE